MDTQKKLPIVRIQGYKESFKCEFDFEDFSIEDTIEFILTLAAAGFKGTTFERKQEKPDIVGKTGKIDLVEQTKTKNGKEAYIAHILLDDAAEGDEKPAVMFFAKGAARKGDKVKIKKNEAGFISFDLLDEDGNVTPF